MFMSNCSFRIRLVWSLTHVKDLYINGDENGNSQTGEIIKGGTFDKITIADAEKK